MRALLLTTLVMLACPTAWAQEAPDFAELWRVGSLWQVGDNRDRVDIARKAIIEAGEPGLEFALTKLDVTDTLQIRCLRVVVLGFGEAAVEPLIARIAHEDANVRRNTADLLADLDDKRAMKPLLDRARVETVLGARLSQLAALSKWRSEDAVPLITEVSHSPIDRIRHRTTALLGAYSTMDAVSRLIELLDDDVFYVRGGAADALARGDAAALAVCLARLREQLALPASEQKVQRIRLLLPVVAAGTHDEVAGQLLLALRHELGSVRGDAADALVTWRLGAGRAQEGIDVADVLRAAIAREYDPFAKTSLEAALERLGKADVK